MGEFMKERLMSLFIGAVMVLAVLGWAMMSMVPQGDAPEFEIPTIMTEALTTEEVVYVLQKTGRVLIEYFYTPNCTECADELEMLEMFATQFDGFVVLEEVEGNLTRFDMIGMGGNIVNLENEEIDFDRLVEIFCDNAIAMPPECLL